MDLGEINIFCRDFGFLLPKKVIHECFKKISPTQKSLEFEQFKNLVPHVALRFAREKTKEIKYRL